MKSFNSELTIFLISFFSDKTKIESILKKINKNIKVLIIENSKLSQNKLYFQKKYKNVKVLFPKSNKGMTGGTNLAFKNIKTKYAIYMDIDVKFNKNIINKFLHHANKIKKFSVLGPNLYHSQYKKNYFLNKNYKSEKQYNQMKVMHFHFILFNMEAVKKIGLYDENIFFYFDEWDYCIRSLKAGYSVLLIKNIVVKHEGGKSYSKEIQNKADTLRQWHYSWSKFYFNKKHYGYLTAYSKALEDILKDFIKLTFFSFINDYKFQIYKSKISGLVNSLFGKKSWKRIKI